MKKLSILIIAGLFCSLHTIAQSSCIPAPDSLGKYLATVFLQQGDLTRTAAYPDQKTAATIERLRAEGIIQESVETTADIAGTEGRMEQYLVTLWTQLLAQAALKKITPNNTVYDRTYFSVYPLDKDKNYYTIYIAFLKDNVPFAIEVTALADKQKWAITHIGNAIFKPVNRRKNELSFIDSPLLPGAAKTKIREENLPSADLTGTCLSNPAPFIREVVQQLTAHKSVVEFSGLISETDFETQALPDFIQLLDKAIKAKGTPAAELKELNTMRSDFKNTPGLAYRKQFTDDITALSDYLYTAKITSPAMENIAFIIKNYEQEVWGNGKTILEADVLFKTAEGKEGIRFSAFWLKGRWQLISMQSTTYGVSAAN